MKKTIGILFVVLIAAAAIGALFYFYLVRAKSLGDLKAAEYLPSDAVALVEITDWQRSKTRWKETALHKISQEPEVAAFWAKPKSMIPSNKETDRLESFRKLDPKEIFIAVAGQGANGPKVIGGFDFSGNQKDAESLVADLKSDLKNEFPDGKSDIEKYGSSEIETFTHEESTVATVFKGRWFFASNDPDLLKATLDRVDGKSDVKTSLRENATYQTSLAKLPVGSDAVAFVQMKEVMAPLVLMLSMTPNMDASQLEELKKIQAISAATKLDGENIRDAVYVYKPGGEARPPLANHSMALTSADTVFDLASALNLKKAPALPNPALDRTGILSILNALQETLAKAGLGFDDFKASFGPEFGAALNWAASSEKPGGVLSLDVSDPAKAQKFIDALANGWTKQEIDGVQYYSLAQPGGGMMGISPVIALTDKALLLGPDLDSVKNAVLLTKSDTGRLNQRAGFQTASALVVKPTDAFAYIDSRALFERIYGPATDFLKAMAFLTPHANDYGDLSKLPPAGVISKHLSPIVYSQSTDENGTLAESAGPVTFTEVLFGVGAGAGFTAFFQHQAHPAGVNAVQMGAPDSSGSEAPEAPPASSAQPVPPMP